MQRKHAAQSSYWICLVMRGNPGARILASPTFDGGDKENIVSELSITFDILKQS